MSGVRCDEERDDGARTGFKIKKYNEHVLEFVTRPFHFTSLRLSLPFPPYTYTTLSTFSNIHIHVHVFLSYHF